MIPDRRNLYERLGGNPPCTSSPIRFRDVLWDSLQGFLVVSCICFWAPAVFNDHHRRDVAQYSTHESVAPSQVSSALMQSSSTGLPLWGKSKHGGSKQNNLRSGSTDNDVCGKLEGTWTGSVFLVVGGTSILECSNGKAYFTYTLLTPNDEGYKDCPSDGSFLVACCYNVEYGCSDLGMAGFYTDSCPTPTLSDGDGWSAECYAGGANYEPTTIEGDDSITIQAVFHGDPSSRGFFRGSKATDLVWGTVFFRCVNTLECVTLGLQKVGAGEACAAAGVNSLSKSSVYGAIFRKFQR